MRRPLGYLLGILALSAGLLATAQAAADPAPGLRPLNIRVSGGENTWHPDNDFRLDWDSPGSNAPGQSVSAVRYLVRDAAGTVVVPEVRIPWEVTVIDHIHVPHRPGIYRAEVWLEGSSGDVGTPVSAALRFDDVRPGPAMPAAPAGWIAAGGPAVVRIAPPAGPQPVSGIRGYAISVDSRSGISPCAARDRCSEAETDLRSGAGGGTISIEHLPEGTSTVNAVAVSGSGMSSQTVSSAKLRVDATAPEVALHGAPQGWARGPVRLTARATDELSGMSGLGPSAAFTAVAIDGALPTTTPGDTVTTVVAGEGAHRVSIHARDAAGNYGDAAGPHVLAVVRIDRSGPKVGFARAQDRSDPERIEAQLTDTLSGVDPSRGTIAVRRAGSRGQFAALPTAVSGERLVARWDSDAAPPGSYEFRAVGYDRAGNSTITDRRTNGTRMVLANPLKHPTAIEAGLRAAERGRQRCVRGGGRSSCRPEQKSAALGPRSAGATIPYGRAIGFAGRLSTMGRPLADQPVQVIETFQAGADPIRRTTIARTDGDGAFAVELPPGPSRQVEVVFAGTRTLGRSASEPARLTVEAGVRMRASTATARIGGAPVIFSGRVAHAGAPIPPAEFAVELQFRFAGQEWSEFRTVQTDSHGRFRYPYVFSDDDSRGVRFRFRAFVVAQRDWPYEPAGSRPVAVTGR